MREILFRGKRLDNNEWVYGFYSPLIWYPSLKQTPSIKSFKGGDMEINPETLGQYTGLTDKNGTKIFGGDIVKCGSYFDNPQLVKWDNEWCAFQPIFDARPIETFPILSITNQIEVIGNVYDNPELLEVE